MQCLIAHSLCLLIRKAAWELVVPALCGPGKKVGKRQVGIRGMWACLCLKYIPKKKVSIPEPIREWMFHQSIFSPDPQGNRSPEALDCRSLWKWNGGGEGRWLREWLYVLSFPSISSFPAIPFSFLREFSPSIYLFLYNVFTCRTSVTGDSIRPETPLHNLFTWGKTVGSLYTKPQNR